MSKLMENRFWVFGLDDDDNICIVPLQDANLMDGNPAWILTKTWGECLTLLDLCDGIKIEDAIQFIGKNIKDAFIYTYDYERKQTMCFEIWNGIARDFIYKIDFKKIIPYYKTTSTWAHIVYERLKVAGNKCESCGGTENLITYRNSWHNVGCERLTDLRILCEKCVKKIIDKEVKEEMKKGMQCIQNSTEGGETN